MHFGVSVPNKKFHLTSGSSFCRQNNSAKWCIVESLAAVACRTNLARRSMSLGKYPFRYLYAVTGTFNFVLDVSSLREVLPCQCRRPKSKQLWAFFPRIELFHFRDNFLSDRRLLATFVSYAFHRVSNIDDT